MSTPLSAVRVPVLMYHRVDSSVSGADWRYSVTVDQFSSHLAWLDEHEYRPCTIEAFDGWVRGERPLAPRSVLITFDDGFDGLYDHAFPLLTTRGWPATVFLVSGLIGKYDSWTASEFGQNGTHPLLTRVQIAEMARGGIDFQSHSRTHADLTSIGQAELMSQVAGSRQDLEDALGRPVEYFAYPFGRVNPQVRRAVTEAGYKLAFGVSSGFNRAGTDSLEIRRLDITGKDSRKRFGRKVSLGTNDGSFGAQLNYFAKRVMARL